MPGLRYDPTAWDEILRRVADASSQFPFGGLEVGGVLYGIREGDTVRVLASRPIDCEHTAGPSFTLSAGETVELEHQLRTYSRERALRRFEPVGWYHSRARGEIQLTAEDRGLYDRFFAQPWQVAIVLRPAELQPTKVALFRRDQDGDITQLPQVSEFDHIVAQPYQAPPPPTSRRRLRWAWGAAICASLAAGIVGARQAGWFDTPSSLALRAIEENNILTIHWDTHAQALRSARHASIEITEPGRRQTVACDVECLARGWVTYRPASTTVQVRMRVASASRRTIEEFTRFVGWRVPGSPTPEELAASGKREQLQQEVAGMRAAIDDRNTQAQALEEALKTMRRATQQPPPPAQTTSGRFLWIGQLPKNKVLTITGNRASAGTLTGGLPGTPVRAVVYAAKLGANGLVVYSNKPQHARNKLTEAWGARNGWKKTSYVWDEQHARDLRVIEIPKARNHWNRLAVRSQTTRLAVVLVEWERQ
jgi:hypothetical protein